MHACNTIRTRTKQKQIYTSTSTLVMGSDTISFWRELSDNSPVRIRLLTRLTPKAIVLPFLETIYDSNVSKPINWRRAKSKKRELDFFVARLAFLYNPI